LASENGIERGQRGFDHGRHVPGRYPATAGDGDFQHRGAAYLVGGNAGGDKFGTTVEVVLDRPFGDGGVDDGCPGLCGVFPEKDVLVALALAEDEHQQQDYDEEEKGEGEDPAPAAAGVEQWHRLQPVGDGAVDAWSGARVAGADGRQRRDGNERGTDQKREQAGERDENAVQRSIGVVHPPTFPLEAITTE